MQDEIVLMNSWITPALGGGDSATDAVPAMEQRRPTWWMRRCLTCAQLPRRAIVEVVCLGYYELYVNGRRVSDEPLAPSITRLDRRALRIIHDVTTLFQIGENCIAVWCSSGWYLPHQFTVHNDATPLLYLGVRMSADVISGVDSDWMCLPSNRCVIGPWKWNTFGGEEVDARAARSDWHRPGCDTTDWRKARTVPAPPLVITDRMCPPNRVGESYPARTVRPLANGQLEVDFGTCLSGWVDVHLPQARPDQTVTLRFYDLPVDHVRNRDHSYNQVSIYHAAGDGRDRFTSKFNYAGFRYITIAGLDAPPALQDMQALLLETAMERTGRFCCSNELYNHIHDLDLHTLRCLDLGSYSVDCPHRERNGYGADGQAALPAYLYLLDSAAFLHKWLVDWCDVYEPDTGRIAHCAPTFHGKHSPAWGGIVAPLAWNLYIHYGDRDAIELAQPVIRGYLRFLGQAVQGGVLRGDLLGSSFHGDWVAPDRGMDTDNRPSLPMRELFNSCYLIHLWRIYGQMCSALGRDDDIGEVETNMAVLRQGVHREYYNYEAGIYLVPEQSYQAMPLLAGVVPTELEPAVKARLIAMIAGKGWHMDTGLPGTTLLLELLTMLGEHEVIGRIYDQTSYPGWGHMLQCGATTIWEQWNGFWSQIHSCFAGPSAWFYAGLAGIRPHPTHPGFRKFFLTPAFIRNVDRVEANYRSIRGVITSSWRREDGRMAWSLTVPEGTEAVVRVPITDPGSLTIETGKSFRNLRPWRDAGGRVGLEFELTDGEYHLAWNEAL
jgi:alpha-L-rhamnosidase